MSDRGIIISSALNDYSSNGELTNNPLTHRYIGSMGTGPELFLSPKRIENIKMFEGVFCYEISFYGDDRNDSHEQGWADYFRTELLSVLSTNSTNWILDFFQSDGEVTNEYESSSILLDKQMILRLPRHKIKKRLFYRKYYSIPNTSLPKTLPFVWEYQTLGCNIEGYNLDSADGSDLMKKWVMANKDDRLLGEVIDQSRFIFHTYPTENTYFSIMTNKVTFDEFLDLVSTIDLKPSHVLAVRRV